MIVIEALRMRAPAGSREIVILDGINLEIRQGEFVAIMGPSGSGKSTLLGLIAGLDTPTSGTIQINGTRLENLSEDEMTLLRGRLIGFVFQSYQLIPGLTALENVAIPLELSGEKNAADLAAALLSEVGLAGRKDHYPLQLSGGEQQRVAIARAFSIRPPLLLADEPTGNLDSDTGNKIISLLVEWHRKIQNTMVLVTHDSNIAKLADRVIQLHDGKIVAP